MKSIQHLALLGSTVLLCAACSAAPKPDTAAQSADMAPASAAPMADTPAAPDASASMPDSTMADASAEAGSDHAALMAQAKIPEDAARQTALAKVPKGMIKSSELENEHDHLIWSFDIAQPGSKNITEIQVDAKTGAIVSTEHETPADQAKEAAADMQQKP